MNRFIKTIGLFFAIWSVIGFAWAGPEDDLKTWHRLTHGLPFETYKGGAVSFKGSLYLYSVGDGGRSIEVHRTQNGSDWVGTDAPYQFKNQDYPEWFSAITFHDSLFLFGFAADSHTYFSAKTEDGNFWVPQSMDPAAVWKPSGNDERYYFTFFTYKDRLWLSSRYSRERMTQRAYDLWDSTDGKTWTLVKDGLFQTDQRSYPFALFAANAKGLWALGGRGETADYLEGGLEVWHSTDGSNWAKVSDAPVKRPIDGSFRALGDQLWVLERSGKGKNKNQTLVWTSLDGVTWTSTPSNGPFAFREDASFTDFNGKVWLTGGSYAQSNYQDLWSSPDGVDWTQATQAPPFFTRHSAQLYCFKDRLWLVGGDAGRFKMRYEGDIWSSADGQNWTLENAGGEFYERGNFAGMVFHNCLWMIGGNGPEESSDTGAGGLEEASVWKSRNGRHWERVIEKALFGRRAHLAGCVFKDRLWISGGEGQEGISAFAGMGSHSAGRDVWSSADGRHWTCAVKEAPFGYRVSHKMVVFQDKLWLIGGYGEKGPLNDVWSSPDGAHWTRVVEKASFGARSDFESFVHNGKIWVVGGDSFQEGQPTLYFKDLWSSPDGVNWTCESKELPTGDFINGQSAEMKGRVYLIGGLGLQNDVWVSGGATVK